MISWKKDFLVTISPKRLQKNSDSVLSRHAYMRKQLLRFKLNRILITVPSEIISLCLSRWNPDGEIKKGIASCDSVRKCNERFYYHHWSEVKTCSRFLNHIAQLNKSLLAHRLPIPFAHIFDFRTICSAFSTCTHVQIYIFSAPLRERVYIHNGTIGIRFYGPHIVYH